MKIMNAIGYGRCGAIERDASSAAVLPDGQSFRTGAKLHPTVRRKRSVQGFDFPPVATKTGTFEPFLSCKGLDFSPVTEKAAFFFSPLFGVLPDWHHSSHPADGQNLSPRHLLPVMRWLQMTWLPR